MLSGEGVRRQHGEVRDVAGHNRPFLSGGVRELGSIVELCVADLVGADDLEAGARSISARRGERFSSRYSFTHCAPRALDRIAMLEHLARQRRVRLDLARISSGIARSTSPRR